MSLRHLSQGHPGAANQGTGSERERSRHADAVQGVQGGQFALMWEKLAGETSAKGLKPGRFG